jgi:hypothetical protein
MLLNLEMIRLDLNRDSCLSILVCLKDLRKNGKRKWRLVPHFFFQVPKISKKVIFKLNSLTLYDLYLARYSTAAS